MSGNVFLDTNILVYALDASDENKNQTATRLVTEAFRSKNGVISTQVLKEFFVTVTQKIPKKLDPVDSKEIIKKFALLEVVETNVPLVLHGIDIHRENKISFWDAMIVAAAKVSDCTILFTEDLSHDTVIGDVHVLNPFVKNERDEKTS